MNPDHEAHLRRVKRNVAARIDRKYRAGQREHGGELWKKAGLVEEALDEAVDLCVYLETLREQIENLIARLGRHERQG